MEIDTKQLREQIRLKRTATPEGIHKVFHPTSYVESVREAAE